MEWLREYFRFHRIERQGALLLVVILFGVLTVDLALRLMPTDAETQAELLYYVDSLGPDLMAISDSAATNDWNKGTERRPDSLFMFDPNTLDSAGWVLLGYSPKQAAVIVRFRDRSGGFRDTAHMGRMSMLSERMDRLEPYIRFDPATLPAPKEPFRYEPKTPRPAPAPRPKVHINSADTVELATLPGIGPAYAGRIARHRQKLGGYHSIEQLAEVYGMDSSRLALIMPRIELDPIPLRTIDINTAIADTLARHPYIGWKLAKVIVAYRQQHGRFRKVEDLRQIVLINEEKFRQIEPYVVVK
jgi:competence ComEA-like helix-hairpin-helix protein